MTNGNSRSLRDRLPRLDQPRGGVFSRAMCSVSLETNGEESDAILRLSSLSNLLPKFGDERESSAMPEVCCPTCGETFYVAVPPSSECPADLDYDCEVCCRPMVIAVDSDGHAEARGTGDGFGS